MTFGTVTKPLDFLSIIRGFKSNPPRGVIVRILNELKHIEST